LGSEVHQTASKLLPILDTMATRVVVAELELIRGHQTKLNQLTIRLLAVSVCSSGACSSGEFEQ